MIIFHILTIFPSIFDSYFKESILKIALKKKIIKINVYNLRDFTSDPHKRVDDRPFGGGPGMVLQLKPIYKAVRTIKRKIKKGQKIKIILLSAKGKEFNQKMARNFLKYENLIFICGRYEGVDERVAKYITDKEVSIGNYILAGGELPALVIIEVITRLIPGVLGNIKSIEEKREETVFNNFPFSYPVYTRPAVFSPKKGVKWKVPRVLLSGHHKKIKEWREKKMISNSQKNIKKEN